MDTHKNQSAPNIQKGARAEQPSPKELLTPRLQADSQIREWHERMITRSLSRVRLFLSVPTVIRPFSLAELASGYRIYRFTGQ
jgi:hypothetical protein